MLYGEYVRLFRAGKWCGKGLKNKYLVYAVVDGMVLNLMEACILETIQNSKALQEESL
jgi:hypothetical protein